MLIHRTQVTVKNLSAKDVFDFLINPSNDRYQSWWPGVHLRFYNIRAVPRNVGNLVCMDEFVGKWRLRLTGIVTKADDGRRITWQLVKGVRLPAWLDLQLQDTAKGVQIDHMAMIGFRGLLGKVSDPLCNLYFTRRKKRYLTEHVHEEFNRLAQLLSSLRDKSHG
ncbi:MAG TPA: hypothetical protein VFM05_12460 [Candidatus Saccharimonadales bacterium]|nr:hypothetical protein [Candidatus Saccharimonadales bacterium]